MTIQQFCVPAVCLTLLTAPPALWADVYKYVDQNGRVLFSDTVLTSPDYRLEWKRTNRVLLADNQAQTQQIVASRRAATLADVLQRGTTATALASRSQLFWSSSLPPAASTPRRTAPTPAAVSQRRAQYHALIERTARQYDLWPELLHAVIRNESGYRADALSPAGACGLMQLMPDTASRFKVRDIWDPAENIRGGASYLRWLLDFFNNDVRLAIAGYNAGENAVRRHGNAIPPYPETVEYVRRVLQSLHAERTAVRS